MSASRVAALASADGRAVAEADAARVFVGLGSNLDDPARQLRCACRALARLPDTALVAVSPLYRNPAIGPAGQPDFLNAVAQLQTRLPPLSLLDALQAIELSQGRRREQHWGARTLDLDILLYGQEALTLPRLCVPHPHIAQRRFVLQPLHDIAPGLQPPGLAPLPVLLAHCPEHGLERIDEEIDIHDDA